MNECNKSQPSSIKLKSYKGYEIKPSGQATLRVKDKSGKLLKIIFQIVERRVPTLCKSSSVLLGLIRRISGDQSSENSTSTKVMTKNLPARALTCPVNKG